MKSNFRYDLSVEAEISKFIDEYMYPLLGDSFARQFEKSQQKKGIDVIFQQNGNTMLIDDKCAFYYANKNLRTFTFELSYVNYGTPQMGWLLNPTMETTHYNIMWLNTKDKNCKPKEIKVEDIQDVEAMMIPKQNLLSYLDLLGYTLNQLESLDAETRKSNTTRKRLTPHIELLLSGNIPEKPINLKIDKTELSKLAELHVKVTTNQLVNLKTKSIIKGNNQETIIQPAGAQAERIVFRSDRA